MVNQDRRDGPVSFEKWMSALELYYLHKQKQASKYCANMKTGTDLTRALTLGQIGRRAAFRFEALQLIDLGQQVQTGRRDVCACFDLKAKIGTSSVLWQATGELRRLRE